MTTAKGIGLGFKREMADDFFVNQTLKPDFVEIAPENWMGMGGYYSRMLDQLAAQFPIVCHGLSLSLGAPEPLDTNYLKQLRRFLDHYQIELFSEHLSFNSLGNAHFYDLLPVPFRTDAVNHLAERIAQTQDILGRSVAIENVSYYTAVAPEMSELEFIQQVLQQADCKLLLDVNNVYVNAFNHNYDAVGFVQGLPAERVAYIHMAGHKRVTDNLIIDTHGEAIDQAVYQLFDQALKGLKPVPVLLERDFNIPPATELNAELQQLRQITRRHWQTNTIRQLL